MTQRLTYHLESTNSLNDRQHGFREGKSVDTAINELLRKIKIARRVGKHVLVLSIDIKGAFDNLQHRAILKSLDASACPSNINRLFHSLLQNRKVTLLTPQGRTTKNQKQGCPQGSCRVPALWNLVANEILNEVWPDNVHIQAFADDFVLQNGKKSQDHMERHKINRVKSFKYLGIHVDDRLNWLEHINKQGEKAIKMQQNLKRIAGGNWGISQIHRWTLYNTVIERMLAHGSSAWCLNPTFKMKRKLSSIQRPFLLHISGAYRTTPTAALQTILGIPPLHMPLQFEARFTSIYRLRILLPPFITDTQPHDLEMKATGWSTHPSEHLKQNQISFEDGEAYISRKDIINISTDGSKTEHGVGAAFCVLTNDIWVYQWSAKLNDNNTVFQAELTALHEAVIYASHLPNHNTSNIHIDNRASIMTSSNPKSTNETARKIFKILLSSPRIKVSWVKAHAGNIGNERADQLAKDATQHGQPLFIY
ncbi:hypothetical protein AVEN_38407-1 [Araneus ventricosus]|uniref:Retrovirus-related Pol polyprotein from type-1 retrotransposable element R1 n=1 Tax=Araneus ventricosus TaxID=182803 RepID=A0A4Y2HC79_ARAVE|nr:hypothetical protein AVEN_38407-1 [Araneus ventricosus]